MLNKKIYCLFHFILFFLLGSAQSQLFPFLKQLELSNYEISLVYAGIAFSFMLGQIIIGILCDYTNTYKRWMVGLIILSTIATVILFMKGFHIGIYMVASILVGSVYKVMTNLLETWTLQKESKQYGYIRCYGAVGFTLGAWLCGYVLKDHVHLLIYMFLLFCDSLILYCLYYIEVKKEKKYPICFGDIKKLLCTRRYMFVVLILFLLYAIGSVDQYVVVAKLSHIHASKLQISTKYAIQSAMEIPVYYFMNTIFKKYSSLQLMRIASIGYGIKFFLYGYFQAIYKLLWCTTLQMITLPIVLLAGKKLVSEVTPSTVFASSQMIAMAVFMGCSGFVTPFVCMKGIQYVGYDQTLYYASMLTIVPYILLWIFGYSIKTNVKK